MTDNEIIKALKCCTRKDAKCTDCPAFVSVDYSKCREALMGALDLINRQKAEIMDKDRYIKILKDDLNLEKEDIGFKKAEIERLHKEVGYWEAETKEARADIDKAVSEAVKEFAERLKENLIGWDTDPTDEEIEYTINNLVKERVGKANP